ncbi:hypothetical protein [Streptomyces sp. NPDC055013]
MKIEKLTDSRVRAMSEVAVEWLAHGLATGPADRDETEAGVAEAYRAAGLEPPTMFVWLDSPLAGVVGSWVLSGAKDNGDGRGRHPHRRPGEVDADHLPGGRISTPASPPDGRARAWRLQGPTP